MKHFPSIFLSLLLPLAVAAQSVQIQDGAIRAEFSVSDSTKVYFSQGNLQYNPKKNIWQFAKHQWDYVGYIFAEISVSDSTKVDFTQGNWQYQASTNTWRFAENQYENISEKYVGWIDLFGWGTSGYNGKNPYMTSTDYSEYGDGSNDIAGTNYDWGVYNKISNGGNQAGLWRTLTYKEWRYLRYDRTDAEALYGTATVNGVNGCIFLPDNWTTPKGVTFKCGANGYSANTYSASDWSKMEANGAVFFPAAGCRYEAGVSYVGYDGTYWSSSAYLHGYKAYCLFFGSDGVITVDKSLYVGYSVRLVQEVK